MIIIHLFHFLDFPLDRLEFFFFGDESVDAAMDAGADDACVDDTVGNVTTSDYASSCALFNVIVIIDVISMGRMVPHGWFGPSFLQQLVIATIIIILHLTPSSLFTHHNLLPHLQVQVCNVGNEEAALAVYWVVDSLETIMQHK